MRLSLVALVRCFLLVSFSSVGGAQAPLRYHLVHNYKWLNEQEFAETFGICQSLPGAVGANVALMVGDTFAGWRGAVASVLAFSLPAMVFAIFLAMAAIDLAAISPRMTHAELAVTAAGAGLGIGNGLKLLTIIWRRPEPGERLWYRVVRLAVVPLGLTLVVGLHLAVPLAVVVMLATGLIVERLRATA